MIDMASATGPLTSSINSTSKRKRKATSKAMKPAEDDYTKSTPLTNGRYKAFKKRQYNVDNRNQRHEPATKKTKLLAGLRSPSSVIDFGRPSQSSNGTQSGINGPEQAERRLEKMRGAVRTLLECVGEDPDREGLLATPSRYAKGLLYLTKGYQANIENIVNNALFRERHDEMVVVKDIEICSLCEHHLLPFTGKMHIGYIPSDTVIGLSKLARIAEMFSRRLQIQERLTKEVANAIMEILSPQGVAVVMESSHLCMVMRGVEKTSATTITSCVLGCFERKSRMRKEFLSFVGYDR